MKKWAISLGIILVVSIAGATTTAGIVARQEVKTYEQNLKENLNKDALKNITIQSDVPIRIETTSGEPYVSFDSKVVGLFDKELKYDLSVKSNGQDTSINISEVSSPEFIDLCIEKFEQIAIVYLPQQDIDSLVVKSQIDSYDDALEYKSKNVNIKHLKLDVHALDLDLTGKYETIEIESGQGNIDINALAPAGVRISGDANIRLKGQYQRVEVQDGNGDVNVYSHIPTNIGIDRYSSESNVKLEGYFNNISVDADYSDIIIDAANAPKKINIFGSPKRSMIMLPDNISGFEATVGKGYEGCDETYTDFDVKSESKTEKIEKLYYGDKITRMLIESSNNENNKNYILKNGRLLK